MKLLSKSDAVRAVPDWEYWYCYNCRTVFKRNISPLFRYKCPKCGDDRCDPCVWIRHCDKEEQYGSDTPKAIKRACEKCGARFKCYSQRIMPL